MEFKLLRQTEQGLLTEIFNTFPVPPSSGDILFSAQGIKRLGPQDHHLKEAYKSACQKAGVIPYSRAYMEAYRAGSKTVFIPSPDYLIDPTYISQNILPSDLVESSAAFFEGRSPHQLSFNLQTKDAIEAFAGSYLNTVTVRGYKLDCLHINFTLDERLPKDIPPSHDVSFYMIMNPDGQQGNVKLALTMYQPRPTSEHRTAFNSWLNQLKDSYPPQS
jgi:hypothetical protein